MLKSLLIIASICLLSFSAYADPPAVRLGETLTFTWEQHPDDMPYIGGWGLYVRGGGPSEVLGPELVVNGDFDPVLFSPETGHPSGWVISLSGESKIEPSSIGGVRIISAAGETALIRQPILIPGKKYKTTFEIKERIAGNLKVYSDTNMVNDIAFQIFEPKQYDFYFTAVTKSFGIMRHGVPTNIVVDNVSVREVLAAEGPVEKYDYLIDLKYDDFDFSVTGAVERTATIEVLGAPGSVVRQYFALDAYSRAGNRSGKSNEVFYDFHIPINDVSVPVKFNLVFGK